MLIHPPDPFADFIAWKQKLYPSLVFVKRSYLRRWGAYQFLMANNEILSTPVSHPTNTITPAQTTTVAAAADPVNHNYQLNYTVNPNQPRPSIIGPRQHYYINKRGFPEHWDDDEKNARKLKRSSHPNSDTEDLTECVADSERDVKLFTVFTGGSLPP
jgi:hypothetical protein